jgi:hypothetical protein
MVSWMVVIKPVQNAVPHVFVAKDLAMDQGGEYETY